MVEFTLWWSDTAGKGCHTRSSRPPKGDDWEAVHTFEAPVNAEARYVYDKWTASGYARPWPHQEAAPGLRIEWGKTDTCWQCEAKLGAEAFTAAQEGSDRMVICCSEECRDAVQVRKAMRA